MYDDDPETSVKQIQILMEESHVDGAVRVGDLCGFLIEHFARKQKWQAVSGARWGLVWKEDGLVTSNTVVQLPRLTLWRLERT